MCTKWFIMANLNKNANVQQRWNADRAGFIQKADQQWPAGYDDMLALHRGLRTVIFTEAARVNGPEPREFGPGSGPGPAIQMGSFRMRTPEEEFDLGRWYAQYRLPFMARMPGCIAARKLCGVAGWAKHSVLYEFTSLEARLRNFEEPHEALALDSTRWESKVIAGTVHTPGSPFIGERIWPPAS